MSPRPGVGNFSGPSSARGAEFRCVLASRASEVQGGVSAHGLKPDGREHCSPVWPGKRGDGLGECRDRFPGPPVEAPHERDGRPCVALLSRPPGRHAPSPYPVAGQAKAVEPVRSQSERRAGRRSASQAGAGASKGTSRARTAARAASPQGGCRRSHAVRRTGRRGKIHNMSGIAQQCYRARANLYVLYSSIRPPSADSGQVPACPSCNPPRWFVAGRADVCHTASMRYPALGRIRGLWTVRL